jgi:hypothetical protein
VKIARINPEFVEYIPERLEDGVLYISEIYGTAIHRCCCGCGEEVVTPLNPMDWQLRKRGDEVSLYPSIGNWDFPCRSHYWIRANRVEWAPSISRAQVLRIQARQRKEKEHYISQKNSQSANGILGISWIWKLWQVVKIWWH